MSTKSVISPKFTEEDDRHPMEGIKESAGITEILKRNNFMQVNGPRGGRKKNKSYKTRVRKPTLT